MRRGHVDDVDVGVSHELGVGAVGGGVRGAVDLLEEVGGAGRALQGGDGCDGVGDVVDGAGGGVGEEVPAKDWRSRRSAIVFF